MLLRILLLGAALIAITFIVTQIIAPLLRGSRMCPFLREREEEEFREVHARLDAWEAVKKRVDDLLAYMKPEKNEPPVKPGKDDRG